MSNQKLPQITKTHIPLKYDIPLVVLNRMSTISFFPHVVFEFEWRETYFVRFHLGAKLTLSPFRTSWGHAKNELEDNKSSGRHKHFQTLQLANECPKFLKSTEVYIVQSFQIFDMQIPLFLHPKEILSS